MLCAESPAVYCRGCKWQGMLERKLATAVEMRRMRETAAKRKAADEANAGSKRTLVGSVFKY